MLACAETLEAEIQSTETHVSSLRRAFISSIKLHLQLVFSLQTVHLELSSHDQASFGAGISLQMAHLNFTTGNSITCKHCHCWQQILKPHILLISTSITTSTSQLLLPRSSPILPHIPHHSTLQHTSASTTRRLQPWKTLQALRPSRRNRTTTPTVFRCSTPARSLTSSQTTKMKAQHLLTSAPWALRSKSSRMNLTRSIWAGVCFILNRSLPKRARATKTPKKRRMRGSRQ